MSPRKNTTHKPSASEQRGFDQTVLDDKTKEFLRLLEMPRKTTQQKADYLAAISAYDCTNCILTGLALSQKNLAGVNLQNANLRKTLFNGANTNLSGARLQGANLENAELKRANVSNAFLNGANLTGAQLNQTNCKGSDFTGAILNSAYLHSTQLSDAILENANLTQSSLSYLIVNENTNFKNAIFYNATITNINFENMANINLQGIGLIGSTVRNCNFMNVSIPRLEASRTLFIYDCDFRRANFDSGNFEGTQIFKSLCGSTNFNNSNMKDLIGHSSNYTRAIFTNVDLTNADFRISRFQGTNFAGANLTRVNFRNAIFNNETNFTGAIMSNVDFQSADGLSGLNFEGVNLEGAQFRGCNLIGTNFRRANLRGATFEFSDVQGADFEGSNLQNAVLVGVAQNWMDARNIPRNARRGRAQDTHLAFNDIEFHQLVEFYRNLGIDVDPVMNNAELITYISNNLNKWLNNLVSDEKTLLTQRLNQCIRGRLDTWNYSDTLPGVEPPISWNKLIYPTLQYVNNQSKEFQDIYIQILITDSAEGHGAAFSCIKGIVERLITTTGKSAEVTKDNQPDKEEEYTQLLMLISPPFTMKTLLAEWLEIHKEGGDDPFTEDDPNLMNSYIDYSKEQFDYDEKTPLEQRLIMNKIMNDPNAGVNAIRDQFGILYFFGGRRSRKQKSKTKRKQRKTIKKKKHSIRRKKR